jgi:hypothetical protein
MRPRWRRRDGGGLRHDAGPALARGKVYSVFQPDREGGHRLVRVVPALLNRRFITQIRTAWGYVPSRGKMAVREYG